MKRKLTLLASALLASPAFAATFTTTIDNATAAAYGGSTGTITFNDWGYTGPTVGGYTVGANDFQVGSGFDAGIGNSNIGQIQHVITRTPDYLTPDAQTTGPRAQPTVYGDLFNAPPDPTFNNPNMDGAVNFYKWAYTTPANSTFSNMQIDKAGNYNIAKSDMSFGYYDSFQYRDATGTNPDQSFDTRINFQPYTVSDAKGWCGSVLNPNPGGVGIMAGQVTFDFAMDVYYDAASITGNPALSDSYSSTQLIEGFVMRSYGDVTVDVTTSGGDRMQFYSSAVGNNTDPTSVVPGVGGTLDAAYNNLVSFGGAGVVPTGAWVSADSFNPNGSRKMRTDYNPTTGESRQVWDVTIVAAGTQGAVWSSNAFAGYAFILRADGIRILDEVNPDGHSNYVATIPEPESYAMMLAGVGVVCVAARRRRRRRA
jgi:hypothetical protein